MNRWFGPCGLATALALTLAACATGERYDAARDVHALLVAVRDDDRAAFERHVDRAALRRQIEARLAQEALASDAPGPMKSLGVAVSPLAALAGDLLLQPRVFRQVAERYGYRPGDPVPGPLAIRGSLRQVDAGRVCAVARRDGPCLLMFARTDGVWRLSGFEGELSSLRIGIGR